MKTLKEKLGARIQKIRKLQNLTQEKLAEKIGLDTPNLSNIERGKRFVSAETLEKIVSALNITEKELFDFGYEKSRQILIEDINNILHASKDEELKIFHRFLTDYKALKL